MKILRTEASCPYCNSVKEVWFNKGAEVLATDKCYSCGKKFDSSDFITSILESNSNSSVSVLAL